MVAQALAERAPALDRLGLVALKKVGLWQCCGTGESGSGVTE